MTRLIIIGRPGTLSAQLAAAQACGLFNNGKPIPAEPGFLRSEK